MPAAPPPIGTVENGYRYNGGNPADRASWAPVAASASGRPGTYGQQLSREKFEAQQRVLADKRARQSADTLDRARRNSFTAAEAQDLVSWDTTGQVGAALKYLPGTKAYDLDAKLDSLRANLTIQELNQMRQNSPTGAAVGNASDKDMALLGSAVTSLRQDQTTPAIRSNLEAVQGYYDRQAAHARGQEYDPSRPMPAAAQAAYTARVDTPRERAADLGTRTHPFLARDRDTLVRLSRNPEMHGKWVIGPSGALVQIGTRVIDPSSVRTDQRAAIPAAQAALRPRPGTPVRPPAADPFAGMSDADLRRIAGGH